MEPSQSQGEPAAPSVFAPPQAAGSSFTPGETPALPLYGSAAHWSAPPPPEASVLADGARSESHWYGWQTLLADGASLTVLLIGMSEERGELAAAGLLGYALGAPAVHAAHRRPLTTLGSAGLRLALPTAGALIGHASGGCEGDSCNDAGMVAGLWIGAALAIGLDASVFARQTVVHPSPSEHAVSLTPTLQIGRERQVVGVQGVF